MLEATQDAATVRELEAIEQQLTSTGKNRDCVGWGALLADDWSVTHIDGQVITKAQALEMCRTGPPVTTVVDQLMVCAYGDSAVITGRTRATVSGGAAPQTVTLRFTDMFARPNRCWVVVASHATRPAEGTT